MSTYAAKTDGEVALEWVTKHWPGDCEACGHYDWGVSEASLRVRTADTGSVMPLVAVICRNCANTRLLNLIMARKMLAESGAA